MKWNERKMRMRSVIIDHTQIHIVNDVKRPIQYRTNAMNRNLKRNNNNKPNWCLEKQTQQFINKRRSECFLQRENHIFGFQIFVWYEYEIGHKLLKCISTGIWAAHCTVKAKSIIVMKWEKMQLTTAIRSIAITFVIFTGFLCAHFVCEWNESATDADKHRRKKNQFNKKKKKKEMEMETESTTQQRLWKILLIRQTTKRGSVHAFYRIKL